MPNKLRILHVTANAYPPLPVNHHTKRIWQELSIAADQYHILGRSINNKCSLSKESNITLHLIPSIGKRQISFLFTSFYTLWLLKKINPSHILVQCPVFGGLAAVCCKIFSNVNVIIEFHGDHYFHPLSNSLRGKLRYYLFKFVTSISLRFCDKIRSLSSEMTENINRVYGSQFETKISLIPNRVDLNVFKAPKSDYNLDGPIKIVTVGSFIHRKNNLELIKHLAELDINFQLTLIGSGPLKNEYLQLSELLGISEQIAIKENLSHVELAEALRNTDLYIHYSLSEALPRAVMEAMAIGLPVILTKVGYLTDLIDNGKNAYLITERTSKNLKSILSPLIASDELRRTIGIRARKTIENNFEWNKVFNTYRELFKDIQK